MTPKHCQKFSQKFACEFSTWPFSSLSFPWTLAGLEEAKALNDTYKKEVRKYGADFGNITEDEKRALDLWRQYTKEAMANGFAYASAYEIVQAGLEGRKTTTPDMVLHASSTLPRM